MFSYINYSTLKALLALIVIFNAIAIHASSAAAETINKLKSATPTLCFSYSGENEKFKHFVIDGSLISGRSAKVVYDTRRKDVLFKNNCTVYMRYSFDFWQSCQDVELKTTATGELGASFKIPANASTIQIAFFAAYPYDDYKSWGYIWDSNYGKNFTVKLLSKKDLEEKEKFERLNSI
jgi:hypothetical protein